MDASSVVKGKLKDITDCPICFETYKEPKILPCIHTFCMHCLRETGEKLKKNPGDKMPCPICRTEFEIPETGFGGLQKNFFMEKLTEIKNILQPSSQRVLCDVCREDNESVAEADMPSAEMYCIQCHQRLCGECHKHHSRNKLTRNHKFIATGDQNDFKSENLLESLKTDSCDKHQDNLVEIYCSGCQEVVCAICFVEDHQLHVGTDINKVASDFRKEIKNNVDEFSLVLPQLRLQQQELDTHKDELMRCNEDIQAKVKKRRQELHQLVDKDADSLLSDLQSTKKQSIKKYDLIKENSDTLYVYLDSYEAYCLNLIKVGSAGDICRAKGALEIRAKELRQLCDSVGESSKFSPIWFNIADLRNILGSSCQNIVGTLDCQTEKSSFKSLSDAQSSNLQCQNMNMEESTAISSQQGNTESLSAQEETEDKKESETVLECMEWILDSIELECLSELQLKLQVRLEEMTADDLSLYDKLKQVTQKMTSMLETIKTLSAGLETERASLTKVEMERNTLVDRITDHESNEHSLRNTVEDLKLQVVLLNDLVYGSKSQTATTEGSFSCVAGMKFTTTVKNVRPLNSDYRICGIAILENELYVIGSDEIVIIYDLSTMRFKRRWKMPWAGDVEDLKQCNTNKCLYVMNINKFSMTCTILQIDPYGKLLASWSVDKSKGQLSVTQESNVLLAASQQNQLQEYAPDGRLVQVIQLSWERGTDQPLHAIKLTSEHFLISHDKKAGLFSLSIVDKAGTVLKYYGEESGKFNMTQLTDPIHLAIDGGGNILVADYSSCRVLVLSSNLKFKLDLGVRKYRRPRKICIDDSNGRVIIVENVWQESSITQENVSLSLLMESSRTKRAAARVGDELAILTK